MKLGDFLLLLIGTLRLTEIINYEEIAQPVREFFGIAHTSFGITSFLRAAREMMKIIPAVEKR